MNGCWILSNIFYASIYMIMRLFFSLLIWWFALIFFNTESSLHSWNKPHLVMVYYPFYCWILFINILFRIFISMFMWDILSYIVWFYFDEKKHTLHICVFTYVYIVLYERSEYKYWGIYVGYFRRELEDRDRTINFAFMYLQRLLFFFFSCGKKLCKPTFKFMGRLHFWELHKLERKSVLLARVWSLLKPVEQIKWSGCWRLGRKVV